MSYCPFTCHSLLKCFLNEDPWFRSNHQENSSYLSTGTASSEHGKLSHLLRTELFCLHLVPKTAASMSHAADQPVALTLKTFRMEVEPIDGTGEGRVSVWTAGLTIRSQFYRALQLNILLVKLGWVLIICRPKSLTNANIVMETRIHSKLTLLFLDEVCWRSCVFLRSLCFCVRMCRVCCM